MSNTQKTQPTKNTEPAEAPRGGEAQPIAVNVKNLIKSYGNNTVVKGISLRIRRGETFGILGSNGAGKSTTVEMIAGLRKPDSGSVELLGLDPIQDRAEVRQILGVQLQNAKLHDALKVRELVELYRTFYPNPRSAEETISMVQLADKADTRFSNLSGGQQQRLAVALALIGKPEIVILDELTTGLDPRARRRIWTALESMEDETMILVSHAMDEVERLCDRIAVLDQGRIIAEGTPEHVRSQAGATSLEEAFVKLTGRELDEEEQ